jgi:hypothetical protein
MLQKNYRGSQEWPMTTSNDIPLTIDFLTVRQLAERIRIRPATIRSWIRKPESEQGLRRLQGAQPWLIHWKSFEEHFVNEI